MKTYKLIAPLLMIIASLNTFAQTAKAIEADLYKSYQKIDYWFEKKDDTTINAFDSLEKANDVFGKKLAYYTSKYPSTIEQKFDLLAKNYFDILSSSDGLFRIYSWDTSEGGTEHFFDNVFQYKSGINTISILDAPKRKGDNITNYRKMYTFKANNQTYYLCVYLTIGSSKYMGNGIQVFSIENSRLNKEVKLIKTGTGLHNQIYYYYNFGSVAYWKLRPSIYFDSVSKTIFVPLVDGNEKMTHKYITYKFTGQHFEKVKN